MLVQQKWHLGNGEEDEDLYNSPSLESNARTLIGKYHSSILFHHRRNMSHLEGSRNSLLVIAHGGYWCDKKNLAIETLKDVELSEN